MPAGIQLPPLQRFAKKKKLPSILLAAALTAAALMVLVRLPGAARQTVPSITVEERNGFYALSNTAQQKGLAFVLPPGPVYYPNVLLTPETAETARPESTDWFSQLRSDYLSQRFHVRLPRGGNVYALTFTLSGRHAMRVYVNGKPVGQSGIPGTTKADTEIWENNLTCYAASADGEMDVILQTAQFYHYRSGAQLATLRIQEAGSAPQAGTASAIKGFLIVGALLCAAVLLACIYLLHPRPHSRTTLYFALACFSMALRECIQTQAWTYLPFLPGNLSFLLEYFSVVLLTIFLSLYLGQYRSGKFLQLIQYTAIGGSCIYGVLLLFCGSIFYTWVLKYYQALLIACIICGVTGLFYQMRRPNPEQAAALYGIAVFYIAAVSDILMYNRLFRFLPKAPISEAAMLVFVLAQTISLFLMNSRLAAEARETEKKLTAENKALENLNQMKTEFLGNVSHELKTPLTVVSGYAQTARQLLDRPNSPDQKELDHKMKLISSEAERLSLMVRQILDVTRIEEGRMRIEKAPCRVDEIIYAAIETHYPILNKNANQLNIRIEGLLPLINADRGKLSQVIVNLISNAIRFTANGSITVMAKAEDAQITVSVADTGSGIPPEMLPFIFERYHSSQSSGRDTGTGLGLYICKHIIEEHGGQIWVESQVGRGTTVSFMLPAGPL
ncbi:MAG: ATP-binding protein [Oscillospiraceae bacterium]|nr:ATP-binding protein [Oscillospiraceae bacterium]